MKKKGGYYPPEVHQVLISEEEDVLLKVSIHVDEDQEDTDDSDKVKEDRGDWWNENVWNKDWGLSGNV